MARSSIQHFRFNEPSIEEQYADWEKCPRLFVYGTLKLGFPNNLGVIYRCSVDTGEYQQILRSMQRGRTVKEFGLWGLTYGFPFMTTDSPRTVRVRGEVYEVPFGVFEGCDSLEAYPNMYDRSIIEIEQDNGEVVEAWAYHQDHDSVYTNTVSPDQFVESGNWGH